MSVDLEGGILKKLLGRLSVVLTLVAASAIAAAGPAYAADAVITRPDIFLGSEPNPNHQPLLLRSTSREIILAADRYRWYNSFDGWAGQTVSNYRDITLAADTYSWNCWTFPQGDGSYYVSYCTLIRKKDNSVVYTPNLYVYPDGSGWNGSEYGEWWSAWESRLTRCSESSVC
ncbi:hypothetical protein [Micromonospora globbae]|uniref:hypothetical protein n=1 Tax=Micromonospora globbae TaxID=1894969 RepID=UPI00344917F9